MVKDGINEAKELIKDKAGFILSNLLSQGGEYGEIFYERSRTTRMELEDKKLGRVSHGYDEGVGLRLIKNGKTFYGYTTEPTLENLLELAKTLARGEGYGPVAIGLKYTEGWTPVVIDPDTADMKFRAEILRRAEEKARSYGDKVKQVLSVLMDKTREVLIVNSLGEMTEDTQKRVVFFVEVVASDGEVLQRGYESLGGRKGFEIFEETPPEAVAQKAAERALLMLSAKPAPAGQFTVVLSSQAGGTMIHEAVGHGLEADLVQKGLSVYAGKVGEKVASDLVTVIDDATLPQHNGSFTIDDEGVPAQRKVLIKDGYLVGYMYDRLRAMKEGRESTGNGRRQSYAHIPMVRMTNTYIDQGKDDPEAIVKDTKNGVYVVKMGGGEVNTVTGDFVFEVMEGYMIENGEITYPIRGATLIGNGPKALQDIDAVGNDLGWAIGTCGKDGQGVPVTDAQPTVRIRQLTLGGCQVCE
ncbi:TldD/PmbA family protein [Hydrogenivirga sp. 128-5-R1-1]|uniref:TldD/PmbA family protein n=1 Tax=Hydrogenivirga sp. 128-5-R1-1 TaxID=392423 RepID=UPI00015F1861|nr:TldD/PmbA family protein [Hydrogenivirga sp. 128-5-R1-1]EDP75427.1 TldD protein [Hydrogenivirga sp. 128-5-R1-1]